MCGRFTLATTPDALAQELELEGLPDLPPRYNVAPGQEIAIVVGRELRTAKWGLVPRWGATAGAVKPQTLARAETLADRPAFRDAFRTGRCVVPVTGFFEWKGAGARRAPYLVRREDGRPFLLAAIHDVANGVATVAIVTTEANTLVGEIHDRMPVVLDAAARKAWLDPRTPLEDLEALMCPSGVSGFAAHRVSKKVNDAGFDRPEVLQPEAEPDPDDDLPLFRRRPADQ